MSSSRHNIHLNTELKFHYFAFDAISKNFKSIDQFDAIVLYVHSTSTGKDTVALVCLNASSENRSTISNSIVGRDVFNVTDLNDLDDNGIIDTDDDYVLVIMDMGSEDDEARGSFQEIGDGIYELIISNFNPTNVVGDITNYYLKEEVIAHHGDETYTITNSYRIYSEKIVLQSDMVAYEYSLSLSPVINASADKDHYVVATAEVTLDEKISGTSQSYNYVDSITVSNEEESQSFDPVFYYKNGKFYIILFCQISDGVATIQKTNQSDPEGDEAISISDVESSINLNVKLNLYDSVELNDILTLSVS